MTTQTVPSRSAAVRSFLEVLDQRAPVHELDRLAADPERRAVVSELVCGRVEASIPERRAASQMIRNSGTDGLPGRSTSARRGRSGSCGREAQRSVGIEQRVDEDGKHRRVRGVELRLDARQVDRLAQALVEDVGVPDAGRRVGVELEELDLVAG